MIAAMKRKVNIEETKEGAQKVLAEMNDMIRGRDFAKMVVDERFERLQAKLNELGWLGLVGKMDMKGKLLHVQLKLVDPASKEAQDLP